MRIPDMYPLEGRIVENVGARYTMDLRLRILKAVTEFTSDANVRSGVLRWHFGFEMRMRFPSC